MGRVELSLFRKVLHDFRAHSTRRSRPDGNRIKALDGLRALAIIGVVAYHTRPALMRGGFLGVTVFFVVSGFLITRSVETLHTTKEGFHYWRYLWKKIKRLAFPVFSLIAVLPPVLYCFAPSLARKFVADALPSITFVSNVTYIVRHVSYFDATGLPSVLTHLWFASLLMQFYLLWPLILMLMHRFGMSKKAKTGLTAILFLISSLLMVGFSFSPGGLSRAYYGLDTRLSELLVGAFVALVQSEGRMSSLRTVEQDGTLRSQVSGLLWGLAGFSLIAALVLLFLSADGNSRFLYRGGFQCVAITGGLLLVILEDEENFCSRLLGSRIFVHFGSISFSLYLLHYPLLAIMNPATRTSPLKWWGWLVQFVIIWLVAELWHTFVERPRFSGDNTVPVKLSIRSVTKVLTVLGVVVALTCTVAPKQVARPYEERNARFRHEQHYAVELMLGNTSDVRRRHAPYLERHTVPQPSVNLPQRLVPHALKVPKNLSTHGWTYTEASGVCTADPLIISDSVEMGAQDFVQSHIPAAIQDGQVGRPMSAGPGVFAQHAASGQPSSVVIFALGTNGPINDTSQLEQLVQSTHGSPIYLTTIRVPREWQDQNNSMIRQVASRHRNVGILDWYDASEGHPEYFYDDGTHLTPGEGGGREAYGLLIRQGLCGS